jgi:hypothetical protein
MRKPEATLYTSCPGIPGSRNTGIPSDRRETKGYPHKKSSTQRRKSELVSGWGQTHCRNGHVHVPKGNFLIKTQYAAEKKPYITSLPHNRPEDHSNLHETGGAPLMINLDIYCKAIHLLERQLAQYTEGGT